MLYTATPNFRPAKEGCCRMAPKALDSSGGEVSVGKVSMVLPGAEARRDWASLVRLSALRERRARA